MKIFILIGIGLSHCSTGYGTYSSNLGSQKKQANFYYLGNFWILTFSEQVLKTKYFANTKWQTRIAAARSSTRLSTMEVRKPTSRIWFRKRIGRRYFLDPNGGCWETGWKILPFILLNSPDVIYLGLQLEGDLLVPLKGEVQVLHLPAVHRDI